MLLLHMCCHSFISGVQVLERRSENVQRETNYGTDYFYIVFVMFILSVPCRKPEDNLVTCCTIFPVEKLLLTNSCTPERVGGAKAQQRKAITLSRDECKQVSIIFLMHTLQGWEQFLLWEIDKQELCLSTEVLIIQILAVQKV